MQKIQKYIPDPMSGRLLKHNTGDLYKVSDIDPIIAERDELKAENDRLQQENSELIQLIKEADKLKKKLELARTSDERFVYRDLWYIWRAEVEKAGIKL